jgi:sugar phosphate isomerase/epimerase
LDRETLGEIKAAGISAVELSFSFDDYMNQIDFPNNWQRVATLAQAFGIELWSIHLPFSSDLDISHPEDKQRAVTLHTHQVLIEAAGKAGIQVAVLHPSSEPIQDQERLKRLGRSREAIIQLRSVCDLNGMRLAVENLPRTCLCNRAAEMIALLQGTGAGIVFDTNHALFEDNIAFLSALADSDLTIESLHISDYDRVDERHRLPGDGVNDWDGIFFQLQRAGYRGPMLYEVSGQPKERDEITFAQLADNMNRLASGDMTGPNPT